MRKCLREPLLHSLLPGALLFLAYGLLQGPGRGGEPQSIVVTQGQVEHLASSFANTWQRPPAPQELTGLVRDRVREEVYYREALALGLDQDDIVIRRRLRQKMEFVSEDIAAQPEPTEPDLNVYLQAHPEAFRVEPRFGFGQVYLNPQTHGHQLARDAARLLAQLNQAGPQADVSVLGDSLMLQPQYVSVRGGEVARRFGEQFARALASLAPGAWQGPVESGYGVHLVKVSERTEGGLPALADVRDAVRREWENAQRLEANEQFYQRLLERYTVTIEGLEPSAAAGKPAAGAQQ